MIVGIIGGTGVDSSIIESEKEHKVTTPYGDPSDMIIEGKIGNVKCFFVLRHGKGHRLNPSIVNYRANIHALKELGVTHIIASAAVGSLKEDFMPGDLVFTDQFIDRTTQRKSTFHDKDRTMHIPMAEPFCPEMRRQLTETAKRLKIPHKDKGTNVVMEGPRFSSRAESELYRSWGADTINMTMLPESVLAREAGIHYAAIAMVTDYDCWKDTVVDVAEILETMKGNADKVKRLIRSVVPELKDNNGCSCATDHKHAFV
ncbi:MAG: S-methyl-5'-thioadenosine phosphorylase [Nanoarchaeota archaeon]|nr:S-methyl-5'-thioadenosine phosphorylase [Nanoarchaeota archaeon]